ncbi:hypothetical protein FTO70_12040 [Methanosarcina sp. KYL-1]|uniref:hypothetical protein n=1 Tax=Methanosarcina sp. KYL-1 TaxID=2602068 RepID=UPI002100CC36|nr:hypothetical protein [Methanosarcina sp. KYL-1]MCQ1536389.1 hypothetical protein [Methanosarcina sp. KYL-1]
MELKTEIKKGKKVEKMNLNGKSIVKVVASVSAVLMLFTLLPFGASAVAEMNESRSGECCGECNTICVRNCTEDSNMFSGSNGVGDCLQVRTRTCDCDPEDSEVSLAADQMQDRTGECDCDCGCDCEGDRTQDQTQGKDQTLDQKPTQIRTRDCDGDCANQV